jgi:ubiquinone/menaquinone biosynthesis C-methylase UbiE
MDYIAQNKQAWEETFEHRRPGWGDDNARRLLEERLPFFCPDIAMELEKIDFQGKALAQICCNNGRELLSLVKRGALRGVGFDIAENILAQAERTAAGAGIANCKFVCTNALDIGAEYHAAFDFLFFTVGALTWFQDLHPILQKASRCLKPGGMLMIHDMHPCINMLPAPGEPGFDPENLNRFGYSYFRKEPWIETNGIGYISEEYPSKTFTSFSHTMADIVNAVAGTGLRITKLEEYDYDVGLTDVYDGKGIPLSYLLMAEKE